MKITLNELTELTDKALKNYGYADDEIPIIRQALFYAQLRGNNQGVVKLIGAGMPKSPDAGEIAIVKETPVSARIDGSGNQAMVVMKRAVTVALAKAKKRLCNRWHVQYVDLIRGYRQLCHAARGAGGVNRAGVRPFNRNAG